MTEQPATDPHEIEDRRRACTKIMLLLGYCVLVFGGLASGVGVVFWICANC